MPKQKEIDELDIDDSEPKKKSFFDTLSENHAVVRTKGDVSILAWEDNLLHPGVKQPAFMSEKDFNLFYRNRKVRVQVEVKKRDGTSHEPKKFKEERVPATKIWLESPKRPTYDGLGMFPGNAEKVVNNKLNLWTGFGVKPEPGDWTLMQRHILKVLAKGNKEWASYITRWAAWKVQHPGEPPEVALCFQGGKGSGKGAFARAITQLFGSHGMQVSDRKHVMSNFNAHLISCALLYSDEAIWPKASGDEEDGNIKRLITEPTLFIEPKGIDRFEVKNHIGLIMTGNADWQVLASDDERRYASFEISNERRGDHTYFKALFRQMEAGGDAAMLYDLQRIELGDWHPRDDVPQTDSLDKQKEHSLKPLDRWFNDLIFHGRLPGDVEGKGRVLFSSLANDARKRRDLHDISDKALSEYLQDYGTRKPMGHKRLSGFVFPDLTDVREKWSKRFPRAKYENDSEGAEWLPSENIDDTVPDEEFDELG